MKLNQQQVEALIDKIYDDLSAKKEKKYDKKVSECIMNLGLAAKAAEIRKAYRLIPNEMIANYGKKSYTNTEVAEILANKILLKLGYCRGVSYDVKNKIRSEIVLGTLNAKDVNELIKNVTGKLSKE